jgi:hypothetical protein
MTANKELANGIPVSSFRSELIDLWYGRLPLHVAFWKHAVAYGLALNVVANGVMLLLFALETPAALAIAVHFLPVPYLILAAGGVWRSAERFSGSPAIPQAAKISVLAWCLFLTVF